MDCYFHSNVPSVAPCADCNKPICATCRDENGSCPELSSRREGRSSDGIATADRRTGSSSPERAATAVVTPKPKDRGAGGSTRVARAHHARLSALAARAALAVRSQAVALSAHAGLQALGFNLGMAGFRGVF